MRSAVRWVVVVGSIVMSAWLGHAQDLPTLDPTAFFWTTFDFQEPANAGVFVLDGNRQGDLLAESGRTFLFRDSTEALPLACADGGWFGAGSVNSAGLIVGTCHTGTVSQAVVLADQGQGYEPIVSMALPGTRTTGLGINDWGHVVGYYMSDTEGGPHGMFAAGVGGSDGGPVLALKAHFPGQDVRSTVLTGLMNAWFASGYYTAIEPTPDGPRSRTHGLVLGLWDQWYQWDAPGATRTLLWDVNSQLRAVGLMSDAQFQSHSVLADPATARWYIIDHPDPAVIFTDVSGILDDEPLTFVGRIILPHPTAPNQNKVMGFRATRKPSGFDAPPVSQPAVQAPAVATDGGTVVARMQALTAQGRAVEPPALGPALPTAPPIPRPAIVLNTESCDEGPGMVVPLRMRAVLGCR